uniref:Uncharacterized protein n=1 Tax=Calidris pygmaea TaxID=425635 RepID=A0A8C3JV50_9CHAR
PAPTPGMRLLPGLLASAPSLPPRPAGNRDVPREQGYDLGNFLCGQHCPCWKRLQLVRLHQDPEKMEGLIPAGAEPVGEADFPSALGNIAKRTRAICSKKFRVWFLEHGILKRQRKVRIKMTTIFVLSCIYRSVTRGKYRSSAKESRHALLCYSGLFLPRTSRKVLRQ